MTIRRDEIRTILKKAQNGSNADDYKLLEWCKENLEEVLQIAGYHKWRQPYYARVSDIKEDYDHTYESGATYTLTRAFMEVIESDTNKIIGKVPISTWKSEDAVCECIKRDGKWYILAAGDTGVQLYSLPDLTLVAETADDSMLGQLKIVDFWCPRMSHTIDIRKSYNKEVVDGDVADYETDVEDDIPDGAEWESALFAFVEWYDPYCSGTESVTMLDLRDISDGVLKTHPNFTFNKPEHLPLRSSLFLQDWNKEWPKIYTFEKKCRSLIDGDGPKGLSGWRTEQLDYFAWSGEEEDPRTWRKAVEKLRERWAESDDCVYLTQKFGVPYDFKLYEEVRTREHVEKIAQENPEKLFQLIVRGMAPRTYMNVSLLISGLEALTPTDDIIDGVKYIVGMMEKDTIYQLIIENVKKTLDNLIEKHNQ